MANVDDFADLMNKTVTLAEYATQSNYGSRQYGSPVSYQARLVNKTKLVKAADSGEKISTAQVWIQGTPDIDVQDQITLPDGTTPTILAVERYPDEDGDHHVKLMLE